MRVVQVMPSVEEAAVVEPYAIATKVPFPYVTECQSDTDGIVRVVQVIPSVDEAAVVVELYAIATKVPFPYVTESQFCADGIVRVVQVIPSVDEAAVVEVYAIATNTLLTNPLFIKFADVKVGAFGDNPEFNCVCIFEVTPLLFDIKVDDAIFCKEFPEINELKTPAGKVRIVHVMPSVDVAAVVE